MYREGTYMYREFKVSEVKLNFFKEQRYFEIHNLVQKINKINKQIDCYNNLSCSKSQEPN